MTYTRTFLHGLESTSRGTKGIYFRRRYPDMIIEDYTGPLEIRMEAMEAHLSGKDSLILVGSSYGGLMAALFACRHPERVRKIVLLAPALSLTEFDPYRTARLAIPVVLYHGRFDDVVDPDKVRDIAQTAFIRLDYHLIDDDHALSSRFPDLPWDDLLCTGDRG